MDFLPCYFKVITVGVLIIIIHDLRNAHTASIVSMYLKISWLGDN